MVFLRSTGLIFLGALSLQTADVLAGDFNCAMLEDDSHITLYLEMQNCGVREEFCERGGEMNTNWVDEVIKYARIEQSGCDLELLDASGENGGAVNSAEMEKVFNPKPHANRWKCRCPNPNYIRITNPLETMSGWGIFNGRRLLNRLAGSEGADDFALTEGEEAGR